MLSHQLSVHVHVLRGGHKDGPLHKTLKAPVGIYLVLYFHQHRGQQVRHALRVAVVWVGHRVVQQDVSGGTAQIELDEEISRRSVVDEIIFH